nr:leukocyte elastase inhibitor A-like [Cherax quadricarinatus]UGZ35787.2 putative serine proteinase inhibitor [Cherax quadricarinatus]
MKLVSGAMVVVVVMVCVVSPQCISHNDTLPPPSTPDLTHIAPFGVELFKLLYPAGATGNLFFSPYSIWNALVLAYLGSAGTTRKQLEAALRLNDPAGTLAEYRALDHLYEERQATTSDYVIDLANRVYIDQSFPLRQCVRKVLSKEVETLDFQQPGEAAASINQLVNQTTRGKIPELVSAGDVAGVPMVLVNAAYFKGLWLNSFEPSNTVLEKFYSSPDQEYSVPMMKFSGVFKAGDSVELEASVLEMPYKGEVVSMFVLLPHNTVSEDAANKGTKTGNDAARISGGSAVGGGPTIGGGTYSNSGATYNSDSATLTPLNAMIRRLSANTLLAAISNLRKQEVDLQFPKFKLEETLVDELPEALQREGIVDLFTPAANLSTFDPSGQLFVKKGIHKAVVEVNEEGSEAAAATALLVAFSFAPRPRQFKCNQPFVFFIYDKQTNNILFLGVYSKPRTN